jgi:hypothetical protein
MGRKPEKMTIPGHINRLPAPVLHAEAHTATPTAASASATQAAVLNPDEGTRLLRSTG